MKTNSNKLIGDCDTSELMKPFSKRKILMNYINSKIKEVEENKQTKKLTFVLNIASGGIGSFEEIEKTKPNLQEVK